MDKEPYDNKLRAVGFHSSVRLQLQSLGMIKTGDGTVIGAKTKLKVKKNRLGPPLREVEYDIYFDSGIDVTTSWIDIMTKYDIITKETKVKYKYIDTETGEEILFQGKDLMNLFKERPEIKAKMYDAICNNYIMKYDPADPDLELTFDSNVENMDA